MMTLVNARDLTLDEIHAHLGLRRGFVSAIEDLLSLEPLTEAEQEELDRIREDFDRYLNADKVSEGLVKALVIYPLLRSTGFYRSPITIRLEEAITTIEIPDQDTSIVGRLDILAMSRAESRSAPFFWILVIEAKNSLIDPWAGLPQLLTYAYSSLNQHPSVWALSTNGRSYQFVYLTAGDPVSYQLLPSLDLIHPLRSQPIFQILKGISQGQPRSL